MAGASRDLTVNLIGKTDKLRAAFSGLFTGKGLGGVSKGGIIGGTIAAVGAIGAASAFQLGESFDEAFDKIRVGTGATGKDFEGLQKSFKNILRDGPHSFDEVATAVADLNTRTGLSGKPLEALAGQVLDLSRITGTDLGNNITSVTRLFGDWDIAGEDMAGTMDKVFRASQASGAGFDVLGRNMVQFGAPLRQMGFDFEESLAIFAKFEREGVNMEAVMQGLRTGLGNMAKAGEKAPETFRRVTEEIANMEDPTAATGLAIELFGQRAGPDLAAAIREGRFDTEDFLKVIEGGSDTIEQATKDTDSWRESWNELKNKAFVAIQPVATKFFDLVSRGLDTVLKLFDFIEEHGWGGALRILLEDLGRRFRQFPGIVGGALADLGGLLLEKGRSGLESLWTGAQNFWNDTAKRWFQDLPGNILNALGDLASTLKDKGRSLIVGLMLGAGEFWFGTLRPWIADRSGEALEAIGDLARTFFNKGQTLINGLRQGARDWWINTARPWIASLPGLIVNAIGDISRTLFNKGQTLINGLRQGARDWWTNTARPWIVGLPDRIVTAIGDLARTLFNKGRDLIQGLIDGVRSKVVELGGAINDTVRKAVDLGVGREFNVDAVVRVNALITGVQGFATSLRRSLLNAIGSPFVFHHGGVVPGRPGEEVPALLEAGETVIPANENLISSSGFRSGIGGDTFHINVNMPPGADGEDVVRALRQFQRQNGPVPISVR